MDLKSLGKGEFYMSIDDFRSGFKYFTITYMHQDFQSSFLEKRDAINRRLYKFNFTISDIHMPRRAISDNVNLMIKNKIGGGTKQILSKLSKDLDNMHLQMEDDDVGIELVQLHDDVLVKDDGAGSDTDDEPENIDEDDDSSGVGDLNVEAVKSASDKEKSTSVESMAQMPDDASSKVENKQVNSGHAKNVN